MIETSSRHRSVFVRSCRALLAPSALAGGAGGAHARERRVPPQADTDVDTAQLIEPDIIGAAGRRGEERIQDAPYNISAIGEELLEKTNATNVEDFARLVPGLGTVGTASDRRIVLRGLTPPSGSARAAIYLDEVPLTGSGGQGMLQTDVASYDLERVEILRGPQVTL